MSGKIVVVPQPELDRLAAEIHDNAVQHGFWKASTNFGDKIALIHSEVSEAFEEYRKGALEVPTEDGEQVGPPMHPFMLWFEPDGKPEGIGIELADAIIRLLDLMHWLGLSPAEFIEMKMSFNKTRPFMHGGKSV